jgi:hypothetical protein
MNKRRHESSDGGGGGPPKRPRIALGGPDGFRHTPAPVTINLVDSSDDEPDMIHVDSSDDDSIDAMDIDADDKQVNKETIEHLENEESVEHHIISYIRTLCLPGEDQLSLLRFLFYDHLRGVTKREETLRVEEMTPSLMQQQQREKHDQSINRKRELVQLFYECRAVTEARQFIVPGFPFDKDMGEYTRKIKPIDINDANGDDHRSPSASLTAEFEKTRRLQESLIFHSTDERSSLFNTALGMVTAFAPNIPIDAAARRTLIDNAVMVLRNAIFLMPYQNLQPRPVLLEDSVLVHVLRTLWEESDSLLLHLCAELVVYVIRYANAEEVNKHPIYRPLRVMIDTLGKDFPLYIFSLYPRDGDVITEKTFKAYGFKGRFEDMETALATRQVIVAKLIAFERLALTVPLKDHQRIMVVDMILQELMPADAVRDKQAGIHGLLVYAAPGTGKTLMALVAAAFLDWLGHDEKRKTLLVLPSTAHASFVNDAYNKFKEVHRPRIYQYQKKEGDYQLLVPSDLSAADREKWEKAHRNSSFQNLRFLLFEKTKAQWLPRGVVNPSEFKDKNKSVRDFAAEMNNIVNQEWRVFVDESHEYANRRNYDYLMIRHWLKKRGATFLLTGTAFVNDYYELMSQLRLLGYRARWDTSLPKDVYDDRYAKLDTNLTEDEWMAIARDKALSMKKRGDSDSPVSSDIKKLESALLKEHHSIPAFRAIRRLDNNTLNALIGGKKKIEFLVQPDTKNNKTFYEKLDIVLDRILGTRVGKILDVVENINGPIAEMKKPEGLDMREINEIEKEAKKDDETALLEVIDPGEHQHLRDLVNAMTALMSSRNYGVDLRVLSARQLGSLAGQLTKLLNNDALDDDLRAVTESVRADLENVKVYRPKKGAVSAKKTMKIDPDADDDDGISPLYVSERMASGSTMMNESNATKRHEKEYAELQKVVDKAEMPLRYRKVFDTIFPLLREDETNKVVIFARDKDVMLSFMTWMLLETNFLIYRNNQKQQSDDEKAFPDAMFVMLLSSSVRSFDVRRRMATDFKDNKRLRILVTSYDVGATALNFQVANTVVHLQAEPKESNYVQATARVYRYGQERDVTSYECISKNTGEIIVRATRLLRMQVAKEFDTILNQKPDPGLAARFDPSDTHYLSILEVLEAAEERKEKKKNEVTILIEETPQKDKKEKPTVIVAPVNGGEKETRIRRNFFTMLSMHMEEARQLLRLKEQMEIVDDDMARIIEYHDATPLSQAEKVAVQPLRDFVLELVNLHPGDRDLKSYALNLRLMLR